MTIKKNTLIVICAVMITILASIYIINNKEVINFKESSLSNQKQDTINDDKNINKIDIKDPVTSNLDEPVSNSNSNNIDDHKNNNSDQQAQIEPFYPNKEEEVLTYFRKLENDTEQNTKENNFDKVKDKINTAFFTSVDFLFYNKEVKGITFNELSSKAKVEILEITSNIDSMINKKFPTYKETIKDGGNKVYKIFSDQVNDLKDKLKDEIGTEKYNNYRDNINKGKDKLKDIGNKVIDVGDKALTSVKEWYENIRDNKNEE